MAIYHPVYVPEDADRAVRFATEASFSGIGGNLECLFVSQDPRRHRTVDRLIWQKWINKRLVTLESQASSLFLAGCNELGFGPSRIPSLTEVENVINEKTGWRLRAIPRYFSDKNLSYFCLSRRILPVVISLPETINVQEWQGPNLFTELFAQVPMLVHKEWADFLQLIGEIGLEAQSQQAKKKLSALFWYVCVNGLIQERGKNRVIGAALIVSEDSAQDALGTHVRVENFDLFKIIENELEVGRLYVLEDLTRLLKVVRHFQLEFIV